MNEAQMPSKLNVAFVGLLVCAFLGLGIPNLWDNISLHQKGESTEARVVNSRVMSTRFGLSHEVQYVFKVALNKPLVGRSDYLGREDLWSSLPETKWQEAVSRGFVSIKYHPDNPGNNAPVDGMPDYLDDCVPIFLGLVLLTGIIVIERKRHQAKAKTS
jgi:hypothetical protein